MASLAETSYEKTWTSLEQLPQQKRKGTHVSVHLQDGACVWLGRFPFDHSAANLGSMLMITVSFVELQALRLPTTQVTQGFQTTQSGDKLAILNFFPPTFKNKKTTEVFFLPFTEPLHNLVLCSSYRDHMVDRAVGEVCNSSIGSKSFRRSFSLKYC